MAIKNIKTFFWSPFILIALACFILAGFSLKFTNNNQLTPTPSKQSVTKIFQVTPTLPPTATPSLIVPPKKGVVFATIPPTTPPTNTPTIEPSNTPPPPQATPTPTPIQIINLQLIIPSGNLNFSLNFQTGLTPCSVLNNAKNEGKIQSVTITHYGAPLNSDYIKEINNYSDNWTFTLNNEPKPKGCSSYTLNNGDTVMWKYN